ncbi:hypothetical protein THAOC_01298, partial [Thalassiosira oceanica]
LRAEQGSMGAAFPPPFQDPFQARTGSAKQVTWAVGLERTKRKPPDKPARDLKFRGAGEYEDRRSAGKCDPAESFPDTGRSPVATSSDDPVNLLSERRGLAPAPAMPCAGTRDALRTHPRCLAHAPAMPCASTRDALRTHPQRLAPAPAMPCASNRDDSILEKWTPALREQDGHRSRDIPPGGQLTSAKEPGTSSRTTETQANKRARLKRKLAEELASLHQDEPHQHATFEEGRKQRARERKRLRQELQQNQPAGTSYWSEHGGQGQARPTERQYPEGFKGQMYPTGAAATHPAADELKKWAMDGCPVDAGPPWSTEQIQKAIERGPHISALAPDAMQAFREEVTKKVEQGQVKIIAWDEIKDEVPKELKISPISQIPHKSRAFRTILDLSYALRYGKTKVVPSVNSTSRPTAPEAATSQMGSVLPRLIVAMAQCPDDAVIFFSKFDIQDGFWRMINEVGKDGSDLVAALAPLRFDCETAAAECSRRACSSIRGACEGSRGASSTKQEQHCSGSEEPAATAVEEPAAVQAAGELTGGQGSSASRSSSSSREDSSNSSRGASRSTKQWWGTHWRRAGELRSTGARGKDAIGAAMSRGGEQTGGELKRGAASAVTSLSGDAKSQLQQST